MGCPRCQEKHSRILSLRIRQARSTCRGAILLRPPRPLPVDLRSRQAPRAPRLSAPTLRICRPMAGIRSRSIANVNGLTVHILEAGYESPSRPAVLLLHGFPELAYSWRKVMLPLG